MVAGAGAWSVDAISRADALILTRRDAGRRSARFANAPMIPIASASCERLVVVRPMIASSE
jgi:hypothetical protein